MNSSTKRGDSAHTARTPLQTRLPTPPTYYDILGVSITATKADIGKAFRLKALTLHPDKERDEGREGGTEEFTKAVEAYEVLSDEEQRRAYDAKLQPPLPTAAHPDDSFTYVPSYLLKEEGPLPFHFERPMSSMGEKEGANEASRQRWDGLFVERNGKLERRPASKTQQRGAYSRQSVTGGGSPMDSTLGSLPPRGPTPLAGQSRGSSRAGPRIRPPTVTRREENREDEFAPRQSEGEALPSKPPTPSTHMRQRQLRLHKELTVNNITHTSDELPNNSQRPPSGMAAVGRNTPLASGMATPNEFAFPQRQQRRVVQPQPSPLDLFPGGVPSFAPKTSYAPNSNLPFMKMDAHLSPTRKAAAHSLAQRHLRTTGASVKPAARSRSALSDLRQPTNCSIRLQNLFFPELSRLNKAF